LDAFQYLSRSWNSAGTGTSSLLFAFFATLLLLLATSIWCLVFLVFLPGMFVFFFVLLYVCKFYEKRRRKSLECTSDFEGICLLASHSQRFSEEMNRVGVLDAMKVRTYSYCRVRVLDAKGRKNGNTPATIPIMKSLDINQQ
jgi:hypothetical protein